MEAFEMTSRDIQLKDKKKIHQFIRTLERQSKIPEIILSEIREKSCESPEHNERIAETTCKVGLNMNLSDQDLNDLILLAKVHDLGKTMISEEILKKSGELDENEWAMIRKHPIAGARLAQSIPAIRHLTSQILSIREHWDGHGYPYGLSGSTIPLLARIIAVADAFDIMTHSRPYRKAVGIDEALDELKNNAGKQFDPMIVKIFCKIVT